jgi:hypothetical protein
MVGVIFKAREKSDLRWVRDSNEHPDDGHFERFCPECHRKGLSQTFWEVSLDFWNPHNLSMCRACLLEKRRLDQRRRRANDPDYRTRQVEQSYRIRFGERKVDM